jgi:hypothetical protein
MPKETLAALERCLPLLRLLTIGQVIAGGDKAIDASGLNPWCLNEGRAEAGDRLNLWWLECAIEQAKAAQGSEEVNDTPS